MNNLKIHWHTKKFAMTNESHLFSWCNNPWYRELIAAHLTPVILSLFL